MIRIEDNSRRRLVLSNKPNFWVAGGIFVFLLLGTLISVGTVSALGGFGLILTGFWMAFFIFMISQFCWVRVVFDADAGTMTTTSYRFIRRPRRIVHNLGELAKVTWDEIEIWGNYISQNEDAAAARKVIIVRRDHPERRLTAQELAALGEPVQLDGLPERLPEFRITDVIHAWREQARDA